MNLNGWMRIWVVIAVVGLPCAIGLGINGFPREFPTEDSVKKAYTARALEYVRVSVDEKAWLRCMRSRDANVDAIVENWNEHGEACKKQLGAVPTAENVRRHNETVAMGEAYVRSGLLFDQAMAIALQLAGWLGIALLLYATGWAVAWVLRGFRPSSARSNG